MSGGLWFLYMRSCAQFQLFCVVDLSSPLLCYQCAYDRVHLCRPFDAPAFSGVNLILPSTFVHALSLSVLCFFIRFFPPSQVKKKYFQLAKKYHPDQNKDNPDAKAKFQEVTEVSFLFLPSVPTPSPCVVSQKTGGVARDPSGVCRVVVCRSNLVLYW